MPRTGIASERLWQPLSQNVDLDREYVKAHSDALVREAATLLGTSKTAFVEESAVARARSLIAEYQQVVLSHEEFSRFVDALDEAPVAVPALVDLFSQASRIPQN